MLTAACESARPRQFHGSAPMRWQVVMNRFSCTSSISFEFNSIGDRRVWFVTCFSKSGFQDESQLKGVTTQCSQTEQRF
jgi:hypothetical protein